MLLLLLFILIILILALTVVRNLLKSLNKFTFKILMPLQTLHFFMLVGIVLVLTHFLWQILMLYYPHLAQTYFMASLFLLSLIAGRIHMDTMAAFKVCGICKKPGKPYLTNSDGVYMLCENHKDMFKEVHTKKITMLNYDDGVFHGKIIHAGPNLLIRVEEYDDKYKVIIWDDKTPQDEPDFNKEYFL